MFNEKWVGEIIRGYPTGAGHTALDIGANQGMYSTQLAQIFDEVHAIEAHPTTAKMTKEGFDKRKISNIKLHNLAITDKDGTVKLYTTGGGGSGVNSGGNSVSPIVAEAKTWGHNPQQYIEVPGRTLDTFIKENNIQNLRFIKMDIEGGENFAWYGALDTLENTKLDIILEVHQTVDLHRLYRFFKDFRFKIFESNGQAAKEFKHDTHYLLTNRV